MIFGVIVLHTPEYVPIGAVGNDAFSLIKAFFQNAVFRTTVPVLTFISGYLVFHANLDQAPLKLLKKKSRSLLLPFMAFNLPVLAAIWLLQSTTGVQVSSHALNADDPMTWLNAAFALTGSPVNYPLNFLRDMMMLALLAPVMGLLIRRMPFLGLAFCFWFFLSNSDGPLILRDTMPIVFYMGGMAACLRWNLRALDAYAWPCLCIFLVACALVIYFRVANTTALRLLSPLLVWPASALLSGTRLGQWCAHMNRYSFFLFVGHAPLLMVTWLCFKRAGEGMPYSLYWMMAPVLTTCLMVMLFKAGMRGAPRTLQWMLGGRVPPVRPAPRPVTHEESMVIAIPSRIDAATTNN